MNLIPCFASLLYFLILHQGRQDVLIFGFAGADQLRTVRDRVQAGIKPLGRCEIELSIAPEDFLYGRIVVFFHPAKRLFIRRFHGVGHAKGSVIHMPARTASNLADFRRSERSTPCAVELFELSEGHMVDIHVKAHADGICRDQIIDLAGLIHLDLGVAGPRAERPQNDRGPAARLSNRLRQFIDLANGKGDDGASSFQPAQFLGSSPGKGRESRPCFDGNPWN